MDNLPIYGICILFSIFIGLIIIYINSEELINEKEKRFFLLIYILIGAFCGAKYYTLLTNIDLIKQENGFFSAGLSSYGAVLGILLMIFIYSKQMNIKYKDLLILFVIPLPLMYAVGKIGCAYAGCCHGIEYSGLFNIIYKNSPVAPNGLKLFPIQILETITFFLIFIYILYIKRKNIRNELIVSQTFILCGFFKFLLDFLRMSHVDIILSLNQVVSILFIIIGIIMIIKSIKKVQN